MLHSGMWHRVDLIWADVSEERIASMFRVEKSATEEPAWGGGYSLPWRWRRYVPPKRRPTQDLHSATFHRTAFFSFSIHACVPVAAGTFPEAFPSSVRLFLLIQMCCLAVNVVSLFVSQSLPKIATILVEGLCCMISQLLPRNERPFEAHLRYQKW
jgi:hypothetical protein